MKDSMVTASQRARYLKTGAIVAFILILFYYFSSDSTKAAPHGNTYSKETSPTDRCTQPHDKSKPLVQYALMIDAGSTGSRIHVYKFNNCGPTPELEHEEFKMTEKKEGGSSGLSSYKSDAEGAAKSLDILMDVAVQTVPDEYKSCTPVAVKATAGLRLLGPEMSDKILAAVRERLETVYPFPVVSKEAGGVEIMKGEDEGVYAWITTNYLLGKIGGPDHTPTAAIFDLGGGSTQIVFQPTFKEAIDGGMPEKLTDGDHKYELSFGGRDFTLYQHSHLGYGLMSAREAVHRSIIEKMYKAHGTDTTWLTSPIPNACIAPGYKKKINVTLQSGHPLGENVEVTMVGPEESLPAQCRALAEGILYKDAECKLAPCSFNGVHQPSLDKTFSREDVYIFSYFFDRTQPLGMPESFTLRELHDLTAEVCAGEKHWNRFSGIEGALEELQDRPEWCLDLSFMNALLHTGYEMPIEREVKIAKKIKGNELGWCLGARYVVPFQAPAFVRLG
ncbi:putative nucleoside diphosphatase gda1 [Phaeomoniella chlamydospora]|uniref:guanosine-diphosphatase n=1 Tax=Phaeomoniella chlamydospora TaxID=158046 RepID=A0A0G2EAQ7_PHACM|nr:putative nucleoside diphosphatase gda1 [Phaeomoniella chlamydospora]